MIAINVRPKKMIVLSRPSIVRMEQESKESTPPTKPLTLSHSSTCNDNRAKDKARAQMQSFQFSWIASTKNRKLTTLITKQCL